MAIPTPAASDTLHLFLLPDKNSARLARRMVAESGGAAWLIVGTWPELLEQARMAYLLPEAVCEWEEKLETAAGEVAAAFWSESFSVAPAETAQTLSSTLQLLLEGAGPAARLTVPPAGTLSARAHRHLCDLARLHEKMAFLLPRELQIISAMLAAAPHRAHRSIRVHRDPERVTLNPWQEALLARLSADCAEGADYRAALFAAVSGSKAAAKAGTALGVVQRQLFGNGSATPLDDTVQCLAVRDFLEEVEVAVGMAQKALADDAALAPAEIGFLLPDERCYLDALSLLTRRARLPLSGLPAEKPVRDLGKEAVFTFLVTRRQPAPAMAFATLLSSPLMPWDRETGNDLAQEVVGEGAPVLRPPSAFSAQWKKMLRLVAKGAEDAPTVSQALLRFAALLRHSPAELEAQVARALATIKRCRAVLPEDGEVPWGELLRLAAPETATACADASLSREGMAVFTEHELPWRTVRHLFVLGFENGRYPRESAASPVFSHADMEALSHAGYAIETPEQVAARRLTLLRDQLRCASRRVNIFIPRRDPFGKPLRPSQSLIYLAQTFGIDDPSALVLELERSEDRKRVAGLPTVPPASPVPQRELKRDDLFLKRDLLAIHCYEDGSPKPQSPSSLDTLMVSPLAWLLSRAGLQPREWAPESLDVASKGTLAHHVFEHLFRPGQPMPTAAQVQDRVPELLDQAIARKKPLLLAPEWHVERRHLMKEIEVAALHWRGLLAQIGAEVLGNEVWLKGRLDTLPIHGSADLLLGLPNGRLYVVDYKKAASGQRRERMKKGYDSQASLYRLMIKTGGSRDGDDSLKEALQKAGEIGVVYYLMNDQTALADSSGWIDRKVAGIEELGAGISDNAMDLIKERIAELRQGKVALNHEEDQAWFKANAGITMYAVEDTPLIGLFMKSEEDDGDEAADVVRERGNK